MTSVDTGTAVGGAGRDTGSAIRSGPCAHPCALRLKARCALRGTLCAILLELGYGLGLYPCLRNEMRAMVCGKWSQHVVATDAGAHTCGSAAPVSSVRISCMFHVVSRVYCGVCQ